MTYQDTWVNGKLMQKGTRNCADRYELVKKFCATIPHSFSVLDIGANMCYFGLRLIEDFNCTVVAFEFNSFEMREKVVKQNKTNKLMFLKRKLSIPDLKILASVSRFDVVLAMSVIHHLPGDTTEWINHIRALGKYTIMEFAGEDSTRPGVRQNYMIPPDGKIIGYGDSHLKKDFKRPIILLHEKTISNGIG